MNKKLRIGMVAAAAALVMALAPVWSYAQDVDREPRGGGDRGFRQGGQDGDRGGRGGGPGGGGRGGGDRGFRQGGQGGPGGGGRGGGSFDPAQFQERMLEGLKNRLESSDDEWSVISPLVTEVFEAQTALRPYSGGGGRGGFGGFGGFGGGDRGGDRGGNRGGFGGSNAPERGALETTLNAGGDIEGKLKAYRDARATKEAELKTARGELQAVVTVKQEAFLVLMGLLE